jgi:hypothetical protein
MADAERDHRRRVATRDAYEYPAAARVVVHPDDWRWGPREHYSWREHEGRGLLAQWQMDGLVVHRSTHLRGRHVGGLVAFDRTSPLWDCPSFRPTKRP